MRPLLLLAAVAVVAAGCGARSNTPFTAKGTLGCLEGKGFTHVTTNPNQVGLIAGFATNGGIRATAPDNNVVTIAFGGGDADVPSTERAFRRAASPRLRPHLGDVMSSNRNAVVVWTTTPSSDDSSAVNGCLSP